MKENIEKKPDNNTMSKKFWQSSQNLISPKASFEKFIDLAKKASSTTYKSKLTKLEQQYNDIQMAVSRQNSILRGLLKRNLSIARKVNNKNTPSNYIILKCLVAGGIVYGTIYAGIWGSQNDSDKIVNQVANKDLDKAKSDIITAYNDVVKYIGEQAQNLPETSGNFFSETKRLFFDFYEEMRKKFRPE